MPRVQDDINLSRIVTQNFICRQATMLDGPFKVKPEKSFHMFYFELKTKDE